MRSKVRVHKFRLHQETFEDDGYGEMRRSFSKRKNMKRLFRDESHAALNTDSNTSLGLKVFNPNQVQQ